MGQGTRDYRILSAQTPATIRSETSCLKVAYCMEWQTPADQMGEVQFLNLTRMARVTPTYTILRGHPTAASLTVHSFLMVLFCMA